MTNGVEASNGLLSKLVTRLFARLLSGTRRLGMSWKEFYERQTKAKTSAQ
jgi:hypothetical protein